MSTLLLLGLLQGCIIFYWFFRNRDQNGNLVFSCYLLSLLLITFEVYLNTTGDISYVIHFLNFTTPLVFLPGPLTWIYICQKTGLPLSRRRIILHLAPFGAYFLYSFLFFLQPSTYKHWAFCRSHNPGHCLPVAPVFPTDPLGIQGWVVVELLSLHLIVYGLAGLLSVAKTPCDARVKSWLQTLCWGVSAGGVLLFASEGGVVEGRVYFEPLLPKHFAGLAVTAILYLISFRLIRESMFFQKNLPKYQKSALSPELRRHKLEKILWTIEERKSYLNKSFSLAELAKQTAIPAHHLSQILNEELKMTFFELVNQYRVEAAKNKLEAANPALKVEQLAYEVGYKSKSAFYAAFKKQTAMTPAQYRNLNVV
jgi:AraC-like DNA-binding protein